MPEQYDNGDDTQPYQQSRIIHLRHLFQQMFYQFGGFTDTGRAAEQLGNLHENDSTANARYKTAHDRLGNIPHNLSGPDDEKHHQPCR